MHSLPNRWHAFRASAGSVALLLGFASSARAEDSFATTFPGFISACEAFHAMLVPMALLVTVLSFTFLFWHRAVTGMEIINHLVKLTLIVLLINYSGPLINDTQLILDQTILAKIPARPENVAERYKQLLKEAQKAPEREDKGFFGRIFDASLFESFVAALLTVIAWAGMAVVWFVFLVQKVALLLCWSLSALLFSLFAIPEVSGIALRHLLRIIGILLWPVGLALASTISEGLIDGMVRDSFLKDAGLLGAVGYGLNNLLALAVLAIWLVASSIAFPLFISRLFGHGVGAASILHRVGYQTGNLGLWGAVGLASSASAFVHRRVLHSSITTPTSSALPVPAMPPDTPEPPLTPLA